MSFTPAQLADAVRRRVPGFTMHYAPDFRDDIAASWPASIDDGPARHDWGWAPTYSLQDMVDDMLAALAQRLGMPMPQGLSLRPGVVPHITTASGS